MADRDGPTPASRERRQREGAISVNTGPVLFLTPEWTRNGGVGSHVMATAGALAQHGVDVHVLAARIEATAAIAGVTLHVSPNLFDSQATPSDKLTAVSGLNPAVTHLHQLDDPEVVGFMRAESPVVISAHGYTACTSGLHYFRPGQECSRAHGVGCVPNLLIRNCAHRRDPRGLPSAYRKAERGLEALRHADLAISYSSTIDRHLLTNGITRRRVIPLFVTMTPTTATGHATRRRVVFAGRIVRPKGVAVLIRAARNVDAEFVICGDGWHLPTMRRLSSRLGLEQRVHFKGWLGAEQLARELAEASLVAMPSLWPEPFGLVGIEAQAAGRPVVASSTGGVVDWLQDGVNGLLVKPGDERALARALDELLADPARQAAMGEAGRQIVSERFSLARHVAQLSDAYASARTTWESRRAASRVVAAPSATVTEPVRL
jgi:glycosyltransferase involved in cell wall biosynthesis